jgi:hypothetical protein
MEEEKKYLFLLRLFLFSAATAWGVSVLGLVLPWTIVEKELSGLGAKLGNDIMLQYWLKMAAAVYTLMGCFFVMVGIRPAKYRAVIGMISYLHIILGTVFLINGLILGIGTIPLYVDVGFCFCIGFGIFVTKGKLQEYFKSE